jgi:hypothetical protein
MVNGNAGTEGYMTLSDDRSVLTFAGYAGDINSITTGGQTAPSNLSYDRGVATVDAFTNYTTVYRGTKWYGTATGKTNPRGVATDGAGNFWGCGNGYGSLYFDANTPGADPIQFQNIALTSCSRVINHTLFTSVKSSESVNQYPAGIYTLVDFFNNPAPKPTSASFLHLYLPCNTNYANCIGFDISPDEQTAYVCDATTTGKGGIQKYVRSGLSWTMAYNLGIPGYYGLNNGIMTNAASTNTLVGCFSVAVDWSGTNPIVYATTSDSGVSAAQSYYGNRVIRIIDTNKVQNASTIILTTNMNILTTVVKPPVVNGLQITNVVYKSVAFTPDLRPIITNHPASWSAAAGDNVSFNVGATANYTLSYQWLQNGTNLSGQTADTLNLISVPSSYSNFTYRCVVSDFYGSVTSSVAKLTVTLAPVAPTITSQNLTNFVGNNQSITALVSGTDPKGGYQWYLNGSALSDGTTMSGSTLSGTASSTLTIMQTTTNDAGYYSVSVTNIAGPASNTAAKLTLVYSPPVFVQPPQAFTTYVGRSITNAVSVYGQLLSYQWFKCKADGTSLTPLLGAQFSGTNTATFVVSPVGLADSTNYVIIVTNPGGSITSSPALLSVSVAPAHTFVNYSNQVYKQDFNTLPIPAGSSAEGGNPLTINYAVTNILGITNLTNVIVLANGNANAAIVGTLSYSVDNALDFGYPVFASGGIGGFGLTNKMSGWYGWCQRTMVISATKGDQSQGAIVNNGLNYVADGSSIAGVTNRALGLVATTKTGVDCFSVGLVNTGTNTNTTITLSYTGEIWRNNPSQQVLQFGYAIDPAGSSAPFTPGSSDFTYGIDNINGNTLYNVTNLNVAFATTTNTTINDGTLPANQISIGVTNLVITNWPPNATLWLVWQATTLGTAQDVAIDNVSFSASATLPPTVITPLTIKPGSVHLTGSAASFSFTNAPGLTFSILATNNLTAPRTSWPVIGTAVESPASSGSYQFTDPNPATNSTRFYLLRQP